MRKYIFIMAIGSVALSFIVFGLSDHKKTPQKTVSIPISYTTPALQKPEPTGMISTYNPELPSTETIFADDHAWVATLPAEHVRTMISTGDVIPARSVNYKTILYNNFHWAWEKVADTLRAGDVTFINLEAPLIPQCPIVNDGMVFCGDERHIEGLLFAGVDVANLGNNHAGNYGVSGVENTVSLLKANNILPVGVENPSYRNVGDIRFAFVAYNDIGRQSGVAHLEDEEFEADIRLAQENADIVIVQPHWGVEYTHVPTDRQVEMAHRMIDAGADIVIGNHPHWVQPLELYKNGVIVYAHGNFIFDQMWSRETQEGVVGRYTFYDDILIDIEFIPIVIEDYGRARFAKDGEKEKILQYLQ